MEIKKLLGTLVAPVALAFLNSPVLADFRDINIGKPEEVKITELSPLIQGVIRIIFVLAVVLTFLFLLWGGIQWIMSGGDKEKYEEARNRITAALVGLAIIALAWLIIKLVTYFFGLPDLFDAGSFRIPTAWQ
ncbi:MAG TPA: pilin [Candidatus Bathyarchaeia archaeon]|nr:pilin [Candidatus Bathyarchaeia archaeon]